MNLVRSLPEKIRQSSRKTFQCGRDSRRLDELLILWALYTSSTSRDSIPSVTNEKSWPKRATRLWWFSTVWNANVRKSWCWISLRNASLSMEGVGVTSVKKEWLHRAVVAADINLTNTEELQSVPNWRRALWMISIFVSFHVPWFRKENYKQVI